MRLYGICVLGMCNWVVVHLRCRHVGDVGLGIDMSGKLGVFMVFLAL